MRSLLILLFCLTCSPALAEAADWAVPPANAPAGALPDRPPLDLAQPDFVGATTRAVALYSGFRASEPPLEDRVLDLNLDPRAAFDLVRNLQSLPYGGRLRDPEAVFAAGGGNAHDKAATLADLLSRMGYDTRLVSGGAAAQAATCAAGGLDDAAWRLTGLGPAVRDRI